jgi:hypothetical protein
MVVLVGGYSRHTPPPSPRSSRTLTRTCARQRRRLSESSHPIAAYIKDHPVYFVVVEYYPKGLRAGGIKPIRLLRLLSELGYQCFDMRGHSDCALPFTKFVRLYDKYKDLNNGFGMFTDLLCVRLDLI